MTTEPGPDLDHAAEHATWLAQVLADLHSLPSVPTTTAVPQYPRDARAVQLLWEIGSYIRSTPVRPVKDEDIEFQFLVGADTMEPESELTRVLEVLADAELSSAGSARARDARRVVTPAVVRDILLRSQKGNRGGDTRQLLTELRQLRKGLGLHADPPKVGPLLASYAGLGPHENVETTRRRLSTLLTDATRGLSPDMVFTFTTIMGMNDRVQNYFVQSRIEVVAERLDRTPRTVQRRYDEVAQVVATRLTAGLAEPDEGTGSADAVPPDTHPVPTCDAVTPDQLLAQAEAQLVKALADVVAARAALANGDGAGGGTPAATEPVWYEGTRVLARELWALCRGRGIWEPDLDRRVGPALSAVLGIDSPSRTSGQERRESLRRVLGTRFAQVSRELPADLAHVFLTGLNMTGPSASTAGVANSSLQERLRVLSTELRQDPRTTEQKLIGALELASERLHDQRRWRGNVSMVNLGILLAERGEVVEAEKLLRQAAAAGETGALNNLTSLLREQGRVKEAKECFEQWFRSQPE